jgi:hypothetical protein
MNFIGIAYAHFLRMKQEKGMVLHCRAVRTNPAPYFAGMGRTAGGFLNILRRPITGVTTGLVDTDWEMIAPR